MTRAPLFAFLILAWAAQGCTSSSTGDPAVSDTILSGGAITETMSRDDLEDFAGKRVTVEGTFNHLHGKHATVTLRSGLLFSIPHFDQFKHGDDWFKYVGKRVTVGGILHTYTKEIPGYEGPSLAIETFSSME